MALADPVNGRSTAECIVEVRKFLVGAFPADAVSLERLIAPDGHPRGYEHLDLALSIVPVQLSDQQVRELRTFYVLLTAYYFLLDSVVDGHLEDPLDAAFLTHLSSGAFLALAGCLSGGECDHDAIIQKVFAHVSENANSMRSETTMFSEPLTRNQSDERRSIIGRSNSALLLYYLLYDLASISPDERLIQTLRDFTICIQNADDFGDWEEDFENRRWTPFLKSCFEEIGSIPSRDELAERIYCRGKYELWAAEIIRDLDSVAENLAFLNSQRTAILKAWIERRRQQFYDALIEVVAAKQGLQSGEVS